MPGGPSPRWDRVEVLFRDALALPPDERGDWLEEACDDDALRAEVTSLLSAHETAGDFLDGLDLERSAALVESVENAELESVGPYRVVRELGRGGMGVVYLGHDPRLDRPVAVKVLPLHFGADPDHRRRFAAEAKAASALDHPNVGTVYAIDETDDGRLYIAMAYHEGETLAGRLARSPLPPAEAARIAAGLADAIAAAHRKGIVHRDVKPGNVILTDAGPKLVDFGIAKAAGLALTRTGARLGTASYMSPEQTRTEPVDRRTDVWSLGATLYEMLTGNRPFDTGDFDSTIYAIRHDEPPPPSHVRPDVPTAFDAVVERCLAKDPAGRYPDAGSLRVDLERLAAGESPVQAPAARPARATPAARPDGSRRSAPPAAGPTPGLRRPRHQAALAVGVLVLLLSAGAAWLVGRGDGGAAAPGGSPPLRLAVLPFSDTAPEEDPDHLAAGMTLETISRLSRLSELRVIALGSASRFAGMDLPSPEIGRRLDADHVLEGDVRRSNGRVRLLVRLVEVATEDVVWSDRYDIATTGALDVEVDLTRRIVQALRLRLGALETERLARRGTSDREAYLLYLRGRHFWSRRDADGIGRSRELFERAIERDPTFARAWSGLADAYIISGTYGLLEPEMAFPRARVAAERALAIDDELAEAHTSLAATYADYYYEWTLAERHFRRAIELDPSYATALYWYTEFLQHLGNLEEALEMVGRAEEVDPFSLVARADRGINRYYARRFDEAMAIFRGILAEEDQPTAYLFLGMGYVRQERLEDAVATFEQGVALYPFPTMNAMLGYAYGRAGRRAEARGVLEDLRARRGRGVAAIDLATVHLGLGETERAIDWLETAYEERNWQLIFLGIHPVFDPLRGHPRFEALIERMDYPET